LEIIKKNEPLLVQDVDAHEYFRSLAGDFPGVECFILMPLCIRDIEIGIFTVYGYERSATLTENDVEFVASLAGQVSISLGNILVTEQRIQEEEIGMVGKITHHIMHDFADSFTSIRNAAERLETDDLDTADRATYSQAILTELAGMNTIAQELQEFAHGLQGTLSLQTCSVQEFVQEVSTTIQARLTGQNIVLQPELEYTGPIEMDAGKMKRVFLQILDNAREAMSGGGTITIKSGLTDKHVRFELIDEGSGISPDIQAHIFDPFVSEGKADASGLGMALVKKILNEHQAQINIRSMFARGTTVEIVLPRHQKT
jgi:signal transduction histidine kinase